MCRWPLPAQPFSGPSPLGLATVFYCLRFETSLFVASYDSQGHGGGIRPRHHTGTNSGFGFRYISSGRTPQKTPLPIILLLLRVHIRFQEDMSTETLPSSCRLFRLLEPSKGCLFLFHNSAFEPTCHNIKAFTEHFSNYKCMCGGIKTDFCW
jgi:hypothetical protein